jgi:hypothetical protein
MVWRTPGCLALDAVPAMLVSASRERGRYGSSCPYFFPYFLSFLAGTILPPLVMLSLRVVLVLP